MQTTIIAVGRMKDGPEKQLMDSYLKRCPWPVTIREVVERRPLSGPARQTKEAALILKALNETAAGAVVVALDERGKNITSRQFSENFQIWQNRGVSAVVFLIGGADGFCQTVREKADILLSLGAMTWPHMMVRMMLAEQLYRGASILSGHPYHKD